MFTTSSRLSESYLRRWVRLSESSSGGAADRTGPDTAAVLNTSERAKLIELRRRTRVQAMEIDILERASAYVARDVLPDPR